MAVRNTVPAFGLCRRQLHEDLARFSQFRVRDGRCAHRVPIPHTREPYPHTRSPTVPARGGPSVLRLLSPRCAGELGVTADAPLLGKTCASEEPRTDVAWGPGWQ